MLRAFFQTAVAVALSAPLPVHGEVLISEIMFNSKGTVEADFEWVEVYNSGASSVDLSGWTIEDIQDNEVASPLPNGTHIGAGEAIVLTANLNTFNTNWGNLRVQRVELGNFPTLANSPSPINEILALRDNLGVIRDQVNYDDESPWPHDDATVGSSIFLKPGALTTSANDDGANWLPAMPGVYEGIHVNGGDVESLGSPGRIEIAAQSPFLPSPDAAWSIAVLPDTQNYVKWSTNKANMTEMTEWIRDNKAAWNIQLVLHEGDIVNNNDAIDPSTGDQTSSQQWQNAKDSISVLDGELPYVLATGNHDHGLYNAEDRSTHLNDYFSMSDNPLNNPAQGGILKGVMEFGHLENAYYELQAPDGRNLLVVALEWGPDQQAVDWANQVVQQSKYDDYTAILLTHSYTDSDNTLTTSAATGGVQGHSGDELWDELVKLHGNFEMVFSGHVTQDGLGYIASTGDNGNLIHQMLFDTQHEAHGGNGWIRIMEFLDDGHSVRMRTVSPHWGLQRTTAENNMVLQISPLADYAADFDDDGDVDGDDLSVWASAFGANNAADANDDGSSDGLDLLAWQREYGSSLATATATGVPEPSGLLILLLGAIVFAVLY